MKKILGFLFALLMISAAHAQDGPQPSPLSTVSQVVGQTNITIKYYRPGLKGRDMFAKLTPVGELWRTGANSGTIVTFDTDVTVEGQAVPAGEYILFSIPGEKEWTVMIYKDTSIGGYTNKYDESKELTRVKVASMKQSPAIETMTFDIGDIGTESTTASIIFSWGNTSWKLGVEVPKTW